MGVIKGASAILEATKSKQRAKDINFFSLDDGESRVVRFLQELDYDSDFYNEDAGVAVLAVEWKSSADWRKKIVDTTESEGQCYPAEVDAQERAAGVDWQARTYGRSTRLYINLLAVDPEDGEEKVFVWNAQKAVAQYLLEFSNEEGGITNRTFKVTRAGSGSDTKYNLFPKGEDAEPFDVTQYELVDVEDRLLREVPYSEQRAYFEDDEDALADADEDAAWVG